MGSALAEEIKGIVGVVDDGLLYLLCVFLEDRNLLIEFAKPSVTKLVCFSNIRGYVSVRALSVGNEWCKETAIAGVGKAEDLLAVVIVFEDLDGIGYRGVGFEVLR